MQQGRQACIRGRKYPSSLTIYSQLTSRLLASRAQVTHCDWCILLRFAAHSDQLVPTSAGWWLQLTQLADLLVLGFSWAWMHSLGWAAEGDLSLLGWWRKMSALFSIFLRSPWAGLRNYWFSTFVPEHYDCSNSCSAETIGLPLAKA